MQLPKAKTVLKEFNSIVFRESIPWKYITDEIKSSQYIVLFKAQIKSWHGMEIVVVEAYAIN